MKGESVELNPKLEALLLQKSYENLDALEKTFVHTQIGESDYQAYRQVLMSSKALFAAHQTIPDKAIKKELSATMQQRSKSQKPVGTFLTNVATYRIPAWQAMMGAAAMLLCFFYFGKAEMIQLEPEEVIVYKRDTIYEKGATVLVRDTVYEKYETPKKRKRSIPKTSIMMDEDTLTIKALNASPKDIFVTEPPSVMKEDPDTTLQVSNARMIPKGRSIEQDRSLMDLLEKVY